ncbi:hypothetical protein [Solirhodobacter olei]|uniref:hypothetical protein n=1 Tax=Solirhodobacter olei TaxID=2493082 RepID=UPI000FDB61ED|nr:hypothetical protein [Solirhodobacter olei]
MFWRLVKLPFRMLMALSKRLLVALFLLALVLAIAGVSSNVVFSSLSDLVEAVVPQYSVRAEQTRLLAAARKRAENETRRADAAVAAASDLKDRNAALSQNNDALSATNAALKQQGDTLTQANAALKAENKTLAAKAAKAEVTYQGRTIPAAEAVAEATRALADRIAADAKRRLAVAPGEAMPFYGVPLVAAGTAQDLQDDCAAMRDLHGLDVAFNAATALTDQGVCELNPPEAGALWARVRNDATALWQALSDRFNGLPTLVEPPGWDALLAQGEALITPMPQVTAKP